MTWLFKPGGQSIGASASLLPVNIQDLFLLGLTGWISLLSKGLSRVFRTTVLKCQFFSARLSLWSNSHTHTWLLEKPYWLYRFLLAKWCLCFLICCHSFSSKEQESINFMTAITVYSDFGAQENKVCHCVHFFPIYLPWSDGARCHDDALIEFLTKEYRSIIKWLFQCAKYWGRFLPSSCWLKNCDWMLLISESSSHSTRLGQHRLSWVSEGTI